MKKQKVFIKLWQRKVFRALPEKRASERARTKLELQMEFHDSFHNLMFQFKIKTAKRTELSRSRAGVRKEKLWTFEPFSCRWFCYAKRKASEAQEINALLCSCWPQSKLLLPFMLVFSAKKSSSAKLWRQSFNIESNNKPASRRERSSDISSESLIITHNSDSEE